MKKIYSSIVSIGAAILLVSCSNVLESGVELQQSNAPVINATQEAPSRSSITVDGEGVGTIYWSPSDEISVFYGASTPVLYTSTNTAPETTAAFTTTAIIGSTELASTNIWGLYPHNPSAVCNGSSITTTLPAVQYGVSGTFDDDLFLTVAHSDDTNLRFFNVCGGIKFSLSRDDITSITFSGNNNEDIAGDITVSFVEGLPSVSVVNGVKTITLTPKDGGTFAANTDYYLIAIPQSLSNGFTMTFVATDWTSGMFNYTEKAVSIKRAIFGKKANIDTFATFSSTFTPPAGLVDMGLSVLWASSNLGASTSDDNGDLFAWGEVLSKTSYTWENYKWGNCTSQGNWSLGTDKLSKYNYGFLFGNSDNKTKLRLDDDAAHARLGDRWRIPSRDELGELVNNCSIQAVTVNGVKGRKFTSNINGNSIFLPWTGSSSYGSSYWSSDLSSFREPIESYTFSMSGESLYGMSTSYRRNGCSIRPVYEFPINSLTLNLTHLEVYVGNQFVLPVNILPEGYSHYILWSSSDTSVVEVSDDGRILAQKSGSATITASSMDGAFSAACSITVMNIPTPIAVDMGVSVKWASFNVGASVPEETGNYYAWGAIEPSLIAYNWYSYKWCVGTGAIDNSQKILTKYNTTAKYGYNSFVDNLAELTPEDDVAHVLLHDLWRMPTQTEFNELLRNCTKEWVSHNGINGYLLTSKTTGNTLFFPETGYMEDNSFKKGVETGTYTGLGRYMTSSLPYSTWTESYYDLSYSILGFDSSSTPTSSTSVERCYGCVVRPVYVE